MRVHVLLVIVDAFAPHGTHAPAQASRQPEIVASPLMP